MLVAVLAVVRGGGGPVAVAAWWSLVAPSVVVVAVRGGDLAVIPGGGPWRWSHGVVPSVAVVRDGGPSARHRRFVYIALYLRER